MRLNHIIIGVCTHQRPLVRETITSLCELRVPEGYKLSLVVCDNDLTPSGEKTVHEATKNLQFDWSYLHAPAHNISVARNAILQHANSRKADFLAFLDDDERVESGWLAALCGQQSKLGVGAIVGPVRAEYLPNAPEWMIEGAIHNTAPDINADGFAHTGYTCNVLIDLKHPAIRDLLFDLDLGQSGGEDTAFFAQYVARGGQIAFAPDALVYEAVPPARAQFKWLLRRYFRVGQTHGAIVCEGGSVAKRALNATKATGKVIACIGLILFYLPSQLKRNKTVLRATMHLGVLTASLGRSPIRIYVPEGETTQSTQGISK